MSAALVQLSGRVVRETVDRGSKSERDAVLLTTDTGSSYVLRRRGGPAFGDFSSGFPIVGTSISASGVAVGTTLVLEDWKPLGRSPGPPDVQ